MKQILIAFTLFLAVSSINSAAPRKESIDEQVIQTPTAVEIIDPILVPVERTKRRYRRTIHPTRISRWHGHESSYDRAGRLRKRRNLRNRNHKKQHKQHHHKHAHHTHHKRAHHSSHHRSHHH